MDSASSFLAESQTESQAMTITPNDYFFIAIIPLNLEMVIKKTISRGNTPLVPDVEDKVR